jgi:hypothetical protein
MRQVPDTLLGTESVVPLIEQPVAFPFATLKVTAPEPLPPVTTSEIVVLIAAPVELTSKGAVAVVNGEPEIV